MTALSIGRAVVRWSWPAVIVASALAVVIMMLLDEGGPLRAVVAVWFLTVCPGMAWTRVLGFTDAATRWTLAIAASLSFEVALAAGMAYGRVFSAERGLAILVTVSIAGVIADAASVSGRRDTGDGRR